MPSSTAPQQRIRVAIVGGGIGGLTTANGLINDPLGRFDVTVFERDDVQFASDRGGYQLRICGDGLDSLKDVLSKDTWDSLRKKWGSEDTKAPSVADPRTFICHWRLADVKLYPQSRPIPRTSLRATLLKLPMERNAIRFGAIFERFEVVEGTKKGQHKVLLHFKDPERHSPFHADILLAADGSNSRINAQIGLNNKVKLQDFTLFQSQSLLSPLQRAELPRALIDEKSLMILGGNTWTGFASMYQLDDSQTQLFWAGLLPTGIGERLLEGDAISNPVELNARLRKYLVDEAGCDPKGLPLVIGSGQERIRTGKVTSSRKPITDWRGNEPSLSRVILLGDSIHPMTPGRGMGANQALIDSCQLVRLLREFNSTTPTDLDLQKLTFAFDREMFDRAFKMVKASEDLTGLDLNSYVGLAKLRIAKTILFVGGVIASALEWVGLKSPEKFEMDYNKRCR